MITPERTPALVGYTYVAYALFVSGMAFGGIGYVVFWKDQHGAWFLFSFLACAGAYTPARWRRLMLGIDRD